MQVTCPACSTRYTTDDAKVRGKTVRMRCRACDTVWLVQGPGREEALVSQRQGSEAPDPHAEPYTEPQVERRAAVVKRGVERERRDLFASQQLDEGSVRQTLRPPPAGYGLSGARSEDSVLFTVDSLRAAARVETSKPVRAPEPQRSDDEGLIDLAALSKRPPAASPLGPVAGLASEPPVGFARELAGSIPAHAAPRKKGRFGLVAGSLGAAAAAVAAAVLLFGGDIPRRAAHAPAPVAARAAAVGTKAHDAELAKLEAARREEAKLAADASKDDGKRSGTGRVKGVRWTAPARGAASTARAAAPAAPKAPAADACGCKGNFDCVIRCSAKGK